MGDPTPASSYSTMRVVGDITGQGGQVDNRNAAVNGLFSAFRRFRQTRLLYGQETPDAVPLENDRKGDYCGPKKEGDCRFILQNPNWISAKNDYVEFKYMCQSFKGLEADIWGLSETTTGNSTTLGIVV